MANMVAVVSTARQSRQFVFSRITCIDHTKQQHTKHLLEIRIQNKLHTYAYNTANNIKNNPVLYETNTPILIIRAE